MSQENLRLEPARSIIAAFGDGDLTSGIGEVSEITERDRSRVLRWMYPKEKGGTGGTIPSSCVQDLYREATLRKLSLKADDFFLGQPAETAT